MRNCQWISLVVCALVSLVTRADEPQSRELQSIALKSIDGQIVSFTDAKLRVYCVLGTECPASRFYAARLDELSNNCFGCRIQFGVDK